MLQYLFICTLYNNDIDFLIKKCVSSKYKYLLYLYWNRMIKNKNIKVFTYYNY